MPAWLKALGVSLIIALLAFGAAALLAFVLVVLFCGAKSVAS